MTQLAGRAIGRGYARMRLEWELRIEKYRIFYDLNHEERLVEVRVVGEKRGNRVVVRGEEYEL